MKMVSITGSVEVMAFGAHIEEYISTMMSAGISISDLRNENGIFYFTCARIKYKKVIIAAKEYGIKTKLLKRKGFYFKIRRYFKRYGMFTGIMGYCLIIYLMSNFVWDITVSGNNSVTDNQIIEILERTGISIGAYTGNIDSEYTELTALLELGELSWINVEVNGSRVDVKINERTINKEPEIPAGTPCNVVAQNNGVIVDTEVYRGTLLLQKGSGVSKGDIIVSGTVEDGGGNLLLQHADAKIIAECLDISEFYIPFNTTEQKGEGEIIAKRYLVFLNNQLPLFLDGSTPQKTKFSQEVKKVKILFFETPFRIKTNYYEQLKTVQVTLTNGMAIQRLDDVIATYKENMFKDAEIVEDTVEYIPEDEGIRAKVTVKYRTDIAKQELIGIS